jgi:hypothetical protein
MRGHPNLQEKDTRVCFFSLSDQWMLANLLANGFCVADWEKTSLKPYIDILENHALGLMGEVRKDRLANGQ